MRFIRNAFAGALVAAAVVVGIATPAIAIPQLVAVTVADPEPIFVFDGIPVPLVIGLVTGAVIPALVGLIARIVARVSSSALSPLAKGVLLSGLSVLSGAITTVADSLAHNVPINLGVLVATTSTAFVLAVATYFGLLSRPSARGNSIAEAIKGSDA